jgi:hypothetical protein
MRRIIIDFYYYRLLSTAAMKTPITTIVITVGRYLCKVPGFISQISTTLKFSPQILEIPIHNTKFHENPFSESRVLPRGRTDKKLIVAFHNFTMAPKNLNVTKLYCMAFAMFSLRRSRQH